VIARKTDQAEKFEGVLMNNKLTDWLKNWKRNLLELFVIAGILASAFTTFTGAYQLVNRSVLVALLFTAFFQGGLYVVGHYTSVSEHERERRRTFTLCLAWAVLAFFSVYASALGMFDIQQESLRSDRSRVNVFKQWTDAAKSLSEFKTRALGEINQAKQATSLDLSIERSHIKAARAQHRAYPSENLQKLSSDLTALQSAETKLRAVRLLSITPPEVSNDAQRLLDDAFVSAGEAHAAIPERLRAHVILPRPIDAPEISVNIQKAFWGELAARSAPVVLIVVFAMLLDFLPPLVLFATAPKRTVTERIVGIRDRARRIRNAFRVPLSADLESVKITVLEAPKLRIHISVPAHRGGPLVDIDRDFAEITDEVCRETAREMVLATVKTASGKPLVDGSPLLDQLGDDREVRLSYRPKTDPDFSAYSGEVN
jgi:ABC-type multidrug transport system fused ATPase/permease subunit